LEGGKEMAGYEIADGYVRMFSREIANQEPIICEITSQDDWAKHLVKAKVVKSGSPSAQAHKLWARRGASGELIDEGLTVEILEELDPEEVEFSPPEM
jgi:hypothetical protein